MFSRQNGVSVFRPSNLTYSKEMIIRQRLRSKLKKRDLSQVGGDRLAPEVASYGRKIHEGSVAMTPTQYVSLDGVIESAFEFGPVAAPYAENPLFDVMIDNVMPTTLEGVYIAYGLESQQVYQGNLTNGQITELQTSLRPPREPTPEQILDAPPIVAHMTGLADLDRPSYDMVAAHATTLAKENEDFRRALPNVDDDLTAGAIDDLVVEPVHVRNLNVTVYSVLMGHAKVNELPDITREAYQRVYFYKVVEAGLGARSILSCDVMIDAVEEYRSNQRVRAFRTPEWLDDDNWKGLVPGTNARYTKGKVVYMGLFDMRKPRDRTAWDADAPVSVELPEGTHGDVIRCVNDSIRNLYVESRRLDGLQPPAAGGPPLAATETPLSRYLPDAQANPDRDLNEHQVEVDFRNIDDVRDKMGLFFRPGVACYGGVVSHRSLHPHDDADEWFNVEHFVLSIFNSTQLLNEPDKMLYGFTRAAGLQAGLYRDPASPYYHDLTVPVCHVLEDAEVTKYMALYNEPEVMEMGPITATLGHLRGGHHSKTANLDNTFDRIMGGIQKELTPIGVEKEKYFDLVIQHGTHASSVRLATGLLFREASHGRLSNAIMLRMNPDGPYLSGPRNMYRAFLQVESTGYFNIMGDTSTPQVVHAAMARIEEIGHRFVSYADYMYGDALPAPRGSIEVLQSAAIYAASFRKAVPGSTVGRSLALRSMAEKAEKEDILVDLRVQAFIKAYKSFVSTHVHQTLQERLRIPGSGIAGLLTNG